MLDSLFRPRSVAVIGASTKDLSIGNRVIKNLIDFGFTGAVYPVNPSADEVRGIKAYKSILDCPDNIDVVHMVIPAKFVPQAVEDCGQKGVKHIIINSGGFSETGTEGAAIEKDFLARAKRFGIRILRTELPGNHQQRRRDPRLLQLHLHEAGPGLHFHRRPERRGRRSRSPGVRADGGGHPHLCLQRECRRCHHPRDHALSGGR